ncbi:MAG TPA: hypothetical protein VFE31_01505, partial [Opitutaceae bacterium]|nr:hypothetical protein [Opitutaceae bacterium]
IGPTLSSFGISNPLAQPTITLYNGQGAALATNSGWNGDPVLADVFTEVQAFSLPSGSTDAAMLVTLPPGNYSVEVTGLAGTSGVALAEIYAVP